MMDRLLTESRSCDRAVVISLIVPAVLLPVSAHAMQVGCFFTAMFLGMMFLVCLGITELSKYCICKYLWKVPKTPWLRFFGLTWIEMFLGIAVFASVRTNFWLTALIYLPLAALVNRALLARFKPTVELRLSPLKSYGIFFLFAAALPLSLQVSGVLWRTVTNAITFTEIR
jgi:hypothetical protein